ncbi:uncharacterized protein LOC113474866 [Ciona intestinalis]
MTIRTWNSDQQLGSRNQERLRLRDWLELRIGKSRYPGLVWEDKTEMTFRIPWKHGARHGWREKEDARLFRDWSEHTGRFYISLIAAVELLQIHGTRDNGILHLGASPKDVKQHKANFRCALNSLRDVRAVPQLSKSKGDDAYRVYKMLPKQKTKSLRMWIRKRGQRHVGNIRRRYQSAKTQRQKAEVMPTDELVHFSGGATDIPQFTTTQTDKIQNICGKNNFPQLSSTDNFMDPIMQHTTPPANSCSSIYQPSYFPHSDETGMQIFPQPCYPHSNECPLPLNADETVSESIQVASAIMDASHYPTPSTLSVPFGADQSYEGYQSSGDCFELCKSNDLQERGPYTSSEESASENGKEGYDVDFNWEISIAADESYCGRDNGNRFLPMLQSTCNPSYLFETSDNGSTSYESTYSTPKPVQSNLTDTHFSPRGSFDGTFFTEGENVTSFDELQTSTVGQTHDLFLKLPSASTLLGQTQMESFKGFPRHASTSSDGGIDFNIASSLSPQKVYQSCY